MSLPRIALLGSCVTRDAWMLPELVPSQPAIFIGRASLASLSMPEGAVNPLASLARTLPLPGTFEARCLRANLEKTAISQMSEARPELLVLDLIDERFDLIAYGDAVFNESPEWIGIRGHLASSAGVGRRIPRLSDEAWTLWRDGLDRLRAAFDSGVLAPSRLILHACLWAGHTLEDGVPQALPDRCEIIEGRVTSRALHCDLLCRMYDAVLARFPEAAVIDPPARLRIADPSHRWGAAPFHFIPDYYRALVVAAEALGAPLALRRMAVA